MLEVIVGSLFSLLFPRAPKWVGLVISACLPAIVELVEELDDLKDRKGPERFTFVVKEVGQLLDSALDDIPEWSTIPEKNRDRMIGGLVEVSLFIHRVSGRKKGRKDVRRALRKLRQGA